MSLVMRLIERAMNVAQSECEVKKGKWETTRSQALRTRFQIRLMTPLSAVPPFQ